MSITSIKIKFSKVGINRIDQPRKVNYIPVAVLQFDNLPKKKGYILMVFCQTRSLSNKFLQARRL